MDDDLLVAEVEAYVMNEGGAVPATGRFACTVEDRQSDESRPRTLACTSSLSTRRISFWAWDGLKLLLNALIERGTAYSRWDLTRLALAAFTSRIKPPRKPRQSAVCPQISTALSSELPRCTLSSSTGRPDEARKTSKTSSVTALGNHCKR